MSNTDTVEELRELLQIEKHDLDTELQRQPSLYFKISEAFVKAVARRDFLKEEIARVDAKLYAKHRKLLEGSGKVTEAGINSAVITDEKHIKAAEKHGTAKEKADLLQALKESFHQRSYMLRDLVALHIANYYEKTAVSDNGATKDFKAQKTMDRMAEARKASGSKVSRRTRKDE